MGTVKRTGHVKGAASPKGAAGGPNLPQASSSRLFETLARVQQLAATRHYEQALDLLKSAGRDPLVCNARGVCLMRLGRHQEAMQLFRTLVLAPGCTWMRADAPTEFKTNFATALLAGGHPGGCLAVLAELKQDDHPQVQRLRQAIRRWSAQLGFWQKLNWWCGGFEPAGCRVPLEFELGELLVSSH